MIIGLLEAETLPQDIAGRFGSYGDMFVQLLQPLNINIRFRRYAADQGQLPERVSDCDAYIVTGSRHNAYDKHTWIEALKDFIRSLHHEKRKCLGICFGHQLIAEALGGQVRKSPKGWGAGTARFCVDRCPPWLSDCPTDFNIMVSHQDQVEVLPESALRFAHSEFCPNGGYALGSHIFCLQGHPEFSRDYVAFLIGKRRNRIGPLRADLALDSLDQSVDRERFRNWIRDFLTA